MPDDAGLKLPSPTWPELKDFIDQQSKDARDMVDFWFKLATFVLGSIVVVAGLIGWKTVIDAKTAAEQAARTEAIKQVRFLFEQPEFQKLARDTAAKLFEEGEYRTEVQRAVRAQMQKAIEGAIVGQYVVRYNGIPNQTLQIDRRVAPKRP